jgi:hypothetical protein
MRTKHINVHFHFICWIIEEGKIWLIYWPTADMMADTFTKALPSPKVKHFASELGLRRAWGGVLDLHINPAILAGSGCAITTQSNRMHASEYMPFLPWIHSSCGYVFL